MALFIEFTSNGTPVGGVPPLDQKMTILPLQIIKFWANGTGTKIFLTGLSSQEEEIDVKEAYSHVKQVLGGANPNA